MRFMNRFVAAAVALLWASACVSPTNPFDPEAPAEVQADARLSGRVLAESLTSAEGIRVQLRASGQPAVEVTADSDGKFLFSAVDPGDYTLEVRETGFVPFAVTLSLGAGEQRDVGEIVLTPLSGADASVLLGQATLEGQSEHGGILVEAVGRSFTALTDSSGGFRLPVIAGSYDLRLSKAGFLTVTIDGVAVEAGEEKSLDPVVLGANPGSVAGHVDGEQAAGGIAPLADATVSLEGTSVTAVTNAAGDFTLTGVPPGSYLLRVAKAGFASESATVFDLRGGEVRTLDAPFQLTLLRGGLSGSVHLADTADASGIVVEVTGTGRTQVTGSAGGFAFDALLPGAYELTARRDGYNTRVLGTFTVIADTVVDTGSFTLARRGGLVSIAEGGASRAREVTLLLNAQSATGYKVSEDPEFADPSLGDVVDDAFRSFTPGQPETFTLSDADGLHVVYVVFTDGTTTTSPSSAQVVLDRRPPDNTSVVIASGAPFLRATGGIVTLHLEGFDLPPPATPSAQVSGLAKVHLALSMDFVGAQVLDYRITTTFTLDQPDVDGDKTVYARFEDAAGNVSAPVSASVVLDNTPPDAATLALAGDGAGSAEVTRTPLVTALLDASDANAGASGENLLVRLSNSPGFGGTSYQAFAPDLAWFLTPGDGVKTVYAQFRDAAGNESLVVSDDITLDTAPPGEPTISLVESDARPTNGHTNQLAVTVQLSAQGAPSYALVSESPALTSAVNVTLDGVTPPASTTLTLSGDGRRQVWARFFDAAGNPSDLAVAEVVVDRTPPLAVLPALPDGGIVTSTALSLVPPAAGQTEMSVSGDVVAPTGFVAALPGVPVDVTLADGDGAKTLAVSWRDEADNITTLASATLLLDRLGPDAQSLVIQGSPNDSVTASPTVTLAFTVTDATTAVSEMKVSATAGLADAAWEPYRGATSFTLPPGDGVKTVYARFRDSAGHESITISDTITLAQTPPSATSVLIDGGATTTQSSSVSLTLAAVGATEMALSQDGFASGTSWAPFSTGASLTLAGADEETKVVSAKFRNAALVEGPVATDTIYLDGTAPGAGSLALVGTQGDGTSSSQRTVTPAVVAQLARPTSDTVEMALVQAAGAACAASDFSAPDFQPLSTQTTFVLTGADGDKRVCVIFKDAAGNFSTSAHAGATISLDTTAPTSPAFVDLTSGVTQQSSVTGSVTPSTDNLGGAVTYQCIGGQHGADWRDCGTSTTFTFNLLPNQANTLGVRARDAAQNVSNAALVTMLHDDTEPLPPALQGIDSTADTVSVRWSRSPSADVVGYHLYYGSSPDDLSGASADQGASPISVGDALQFQLSGLPPGTPVYVSVSAVDEAGNEGDRSGELVGVPSTVGLRLLASVGGEVLQVAALGDHGYVLTPQGITQLDLSGAGAPAATGRAVLPNVVPDGNARVAATRCNIPLGSGDCLYVVGNTLEGRYYDDEDGFRAGLSVVFVPDGGTVQAPARGQVITTLAVRPRHVVLDGAASLLFTVDEEVGVRVYAVDDPTIPVLLGGAPHPYPITYVHGAGLVGGELMVFAAPASGGGNVSDLFGYDVAELTSGVATATVYGAPEQPSGATFGTPGGDAPTGTPAFVGGVRLVYGGANVDGYLEAGTWDPNGASWPRPEQFIVLTGARPFGFDHQVIAPDEARFFVVGGPGSSSQIYTANTAGASLSLGATGAQFTGDGAVASLSRVAFSAGAVGRLVAAHELSGSDEQPIDAWEVSAAGAITPHGAHFIGAGGDAFAYRDGILYLANGLTLRGVDVSNPGLARVTSVYQSPRATGRYDRLKIEGNLLFASVDGGTGVDVFRTDYFGNLSFTDVAEDIPAREFSDFAVIGSRLYAATQGVAQVTTFDFTNPLNVTRVTACAGPVVPWAVAALDVRHETAYLAASDGSFRVVDIGTCAAISGIVSPPAGVDFSGEDFTGVEYVTAQGTRAVVSDRERSYAVNVSSPASPSYDATRLPVAGPTTLHGGYVLGAAPLSFIALNSTRLDSGPRVVDVLTGNIVGGLPFSHCGAPYGRRTSLVSDSGVVYASCNGDGVQIASMTRPSDARIKREVFGGWSEYVSPMATDGTFTFLYGRMDSGATGFYHADEQLLGSDVPSLFVPEPAFNHTPLDGPMGIAHARGTVMTANYDTNTQMTVTLLDASDPNTAWPQDATLTVAGLISVKSPVTNGRFLYVPHTAGVRVIDIGLRDALSLEGSIALSDGLFDRPVALYRDQVYVAEQTANGPKVHAYFFTNTGVPSNAGQLAPTNAPLRSGFPLDLTVGAGHVFYAMQSDAGGYLVDIYRLTYQNRISSEYVGTITSPLPLGKARVSGDTLFLHENQGLAAYDLRPLLARKGLPERMGSVGTGGVAFHEEVSFEVDGPWAFLLGDRYRVFDLR